MSKTINSDYDLKFELEMLKGFTNLTKIYKDKKGLENQFALVVINANIAEYLLYSLIVIFSQETSGKTKDSRIRFLGIDPSGQMNHEKIKLLEYFEFKNKVEIIALLKNIFNCRNSVFHNLIKAGTKGINVTQNIINIQSHTEKLKELVAETLADK
jgi:hypothetical protein